MRVEEAIADVCSAYFALEDEWIAPLVHDWELVARLRDLSYRAAAAAHTIQLVNRSKENTE